MYKVKCEVLGGTDELKHIRVLKRVVCRDGQEYSLEDPRHAEIVVRDLSLEESKRSNLLGSKEEHKTAGGGASGRLRKPP